MEIQICIPIATPAHLIAALQAHYPDIHEDSWPRDTHRTYWHGQEEDEDGNEIPWTHAAYCDAARICGHIEALFPDAECLITGNGAWAQGMISRADFSTLAMTPAQKDERLKTSQAYYAGRAQGHAQARLLRRLHRARSRIAG